MNRLKLSLEWLSELMPKGLPYPSSTLISGPGGSGKPLAGLGIVYDWLEAGGSVIFAPLQYPNMKFVKTSLKQLYDVDADDYSNKIAYIQFDPDLDSWKKEDKVVRANLLKPDVWKESIQDLENSLDEGGPGTLVFASALNLLLFSPTYKKSILASLERLIGGEKERSYLFSVSTSAFSESIKKWEDTADNLLFTRMEEGMNLYLRMEKLENKELEPKEIKVPIPKEMFEEIKQVAEDVRKRKIPKLIKI